MVMLSEEDLAQGAVSEVYLEAHMHRSYPKTELFRKTLQTIWHQVKTASEVFVIGVIQDDKTVKGGTGWAAGARPPLEQDRLCLRPGAQRLVCLAR
jgi:hypothetical protein